MDNTQNKKTDEELKSVIGSLFAEPSANKASPEQEKSNHSLPLHHILGELSVSAETFKRIKKYGIVFAATIGVIAGSFYAGSFLYKKAKTALSEYVQENVLYTTEYLQQQIDNLEEELAKKDQEKIYTYDLTKAVLQSDIVQIKKDFEKDIKNLNKEIDTAKRQIQALKKSKVKKDFADLYLKSLVLKRDNLVKNHEQSLQDATDRINKALAQIVKEKNISAVFKPDAIVYSTENVIDITPDSVKLLKNSAK